MLFLYYFSYFLFSFIFTVFLRLQLCEFNGVLVPRGTFLFPFCSVFFYFFVLLVPFVSSSISWFLLLFFAIFWLLFLYTLSFSLGTCFPRAFGFVLVFGGTASFFLARTMPHVFLRHLLTVIFFLQYISCFLIFFFILFYKSSGTVFQAIYPCALCFSFNLSVYFLTLRNDSHFGAIFF